MIEIEKLFISRERKCSRSMSLFMKLEGIIGNYFLSEVTYGVFQGLWNTIYFDAKINNEIEGVKCIPGNIIGYVDREERWVFILDKYLKKFKEDTAEYELKYIGVPSVQEMVLQCSRIDSLPTEFSQLLWIDDDFMYDEKIPFDFDAFEIIDEDKDYLNPKHFSVNQLIKLTQKLYNIDEYVSAK